MPNVGKANSLVLLKVVTLKNCLIAVFCESLYPSSSQANVFHGLGQGILDNALHGYNATLLAYGQTGSGKSYSMVGNGPNKGLIPSLCERLFQFFRNSQDSRQCQVREILIKF